MAMITRGQVRRYQQQQSHPFTSLSDLAHATIASFLPDGNNGTDMEQLVQTITDQVMASLK